MVILESPGTVHGGMFDEKYDFTCVERFLKYVRYDTQSDPNSTTFPSTEKQKVLAAELADELRAIGLADARMDRWGYVFATLPGNTDKAVPAIAFIAHVDTSPQVSGNNVKPFVHKNYRGGDIRLENGLAIKADENPELERMAGYDIITSNGNTLLGADDKAGVAEVVDAVNYLYTHPGVKHGPIIVCFTPDEEVGRGTEKLGVKELGAKYGYTVDAKGRGEVDAETFSADAMEVKFHGISIHPGQAKGKMVNSIKVAAAFLDSLPGDRLSPETTSGREGFVHCLSMEGKEELTALEFIVRDFDTAKLGEYEALLEELARGAVEKYPGARYEAKAREQYRNMKEVIDRHPGVVEYASEAMRRLGMTPKMGSIRGGTDGSRLSFMGLPCPNISDGAHNYHSPLEWVAVQDMEMAVRAIVEISCVWEEKS